MPTQFTIPSSDSALLEQATQIAETFAARYMRDGIVGISFLGAVVRGYFDPYADIDVILYKSAEAEILAPESYIHEQGFEIHCWLADYSEEAMCSWDMAKRWAFTTHRIFYDPHGLITRLYADKIPLQSAERRWLMIEGMAQSNWYCDTLPRMWIARGNLTSAQHMINEGLTYFFQALFGLNNELVADIKWRYYCVEQLALLPAHFSERMSEVMCVRAISEADVERRRQAFMTLWQDILPYIEAELQMPYDQFSLLA